MSSKFGDIKQAPPIEVFALIKAYNDDQHENKVNLSVGAYRDENGKPWVLPIVKTVEAMMAADRTLNHEYLPVAGLVDFRTAAAKLVLGEDFRGFVENRVGCVQAQGGTGALRVCADFLKKQMGYDTVFVSTPTWGNHKGIFKAAGFSAIKEYRYWDAATKGLNIKGMLEDLGSAPSGSVVILHAVCHNPTGVDATMEQWQMISDLCKEKDIFVVMDCAYQGFSTGDVDVDAQSVRHFANQGFEFFTAQSFSKNFGLYNERVGNVCVVCNDSEAKSRVLSQMEMIVRVTWSNPSNHGARVVATVLNAPNHMSEWKGCIKEMASRILSMREQLYNKLKANGCPGNWDHIIQQKGMFSYTGLNAEQSEQLVKKYQIYVMKSGRINMCGLTPANMDYVANAIKEVVVAAEGKQQQSNM